MERKMPKLLVAALVSVAVLSAPAFAIAQTLKVERSQSGAGQSSKPDMRTRAWARYEVMKKRWQHDRARFDACAEKLKDAKQHRRISVYRQIDFMEACMQKA
jgi:hypothetical protein